MTVITYQVYGKVHQLFQSAVVRGRRWKSENVHVSAEVACINAKLDYTVCLVKGGDLLTCFMVLIMAVSDIIVILKGF